MQTTPAPAFMLTIGTHLLEDDGSERVVTNVAVSGNLANVSSVPVLGGMPRDTGLIPATREFRVLLDSPRVTAF
jgi:hypothetical protein